MTDNSKRSSWQSTEEDVTFARHSSAASSRSSITSNSKHVRSMSESMKLPPAVAIVQPELIRSYVHNKKVNNYLVGSTLGEGSFAKVKEALHMLVGEKVAMKIIDKKKAQQDPYVAKNFRREAKLLQMVRHPNILQLFEVIETDTSFYLITDLCSGGELMNYIYKKHRLDEEETHKFMQQIVSAVDHLHRAGIIHRDLKVENMLLDSNMDVKILDFGLSNEEFIESERGQLHCNTQCGSPAYAAPELLGHKEYGKEVDIWSIGVNMYAMLTGCLPYTVEPFNITALHAKMLQNKMNPIPEHLSSDCKDLLLSLLRPNPIERITMSDLTDHPWMNKRNSLPFHPAPFPNRLQIDEIAEEIVEHMVHMLQVHDSTYQLKQELVQNRATSSTAVYNLLASRLTRYQRHIKSSTRRKIAKSSASHYRDDSSSTCSGRPQRSRAGSKKYSNGINPALTLEKKETSFSTSSVVEEVITAVTAPTSYPYSRGRRKSVPACVLERELADYDAKKIEEAKKKQRQPHQQRPNTSALPDVRWRKTSAPTPPPDYAVQNDKEVLLRMHQQGNFNGMARRRRSVPPAVLERDLAQFQSDYVGSAKETTLKNKASTPERRPSNSALPKINNGGSSLPRGVKFSLQLQQQMQNGYFHRASSTPQDCCEEDSSDLGSTRGRVASLTRNVHSYPVSLSTLGDHKPGARPHQVHVTPAWGQNKQTKSSKSHRVRSAGLTMRPIDGSDYDNDDDDYIRERVTKRKISPGDNHLPALSPTEHGPQPVRLYVKSNR